MQTPMNDTDSFYSNVFGLTRVNQSHDGSLHGMNESPQAYIKYEP